MIPRQVKFEYDTLFRIGHGDNSSHMWLVWSDRGGSVDPHKQTSTNRFYQWNQIRFQIEMA